MDFENPSSGREPEEIVVNVVRPNANLNPVDMQILRETVRLALTYDPAEQSFRAN